MTSLYEGFTGMMWKPWSRLYFAAKKLGRYQCADNPTTAIVRDWVRMRRRPAMSSTIGTLPLPLGRCVVRVALVDAATRRDPVVHVPRELRVFAWPEGAAGALEIRVAAEQPVAAVDPNRGGAVVEAGALEVRDDIALDGDRAAAEIGIFVERRLRPA